VRANRLSAFTLRRARIVSALRPPCFRAAVPTVTAASFQD